jgi:hypothetical protein
MWNYLATSFIFVRDGFDIQELAPPDEDGQQWRVLQVRYPKDIPTHCDTQQFFFNGDGILKRMDYTTDVLGGVASHFQDLGENPSKLGHQSQSFPFCGRSAKS